MLSNYKHIVRFLCFVALVAIVYFFSPVDAYSQQRFPKPEFETGYEQPNTTTPEPRSLKIEYVDTAVLILVLSFTVWLVLKKRSRRWILWLSVFALIYFGFYREGCICPIGSVQNITLALFSNTYSVSWVVVAFFLLPLLFSLFFGRVFCGAACPLGAIQDLVLIKPISIPLWLQRTLGIIPFIYLGLAVLFAATGTDFIICRYDPFVGIFRMGAMFNMVVMGIGFLLIGMFVGRPYCRFLCPYGGLLKITSVFSKKHLSITPKECIQCKLCANSCPFDAIDRPTDEKDFSDSQNQFKKFVFYIVLTPILIFVTGYAVSSSNVFLSKAHPDVYLADLLISKPEIKNDISNLDIQTFLSSGKSIEDLNAEVKVIREKYRVGGWILGGFIGLVIGLTLINQVTYRKNNDYQPNRGNCVSCGRCIKYCPVKN